MTWGELIRRLQAAGFVEPRRGKGSHRQFVSTSIDWAVSDRAVVGIVRDSQSQAVGMTPDPEIYVPYLEDPSFAMTFLIRTALPVAQVLPALRAAMRSVDPDISTANERTVDEIVNGVLGSPRVNAAVVALFATVALLLSAIGIYGMLAFSVSRRTREFGIRMALGADARDIRRLLLREAMTSVTAGILCGVARAVAMIRWISSLLFGITPHNPRSFAISIAVLLGVCVVAGYLPLRTAAGMNAAQALKLE